MFNLILFGPPGSGKGTQSDLLVEKYSLIHLSTGNLLREQITNKTSLGLKAKAFMDVGRLVPDEVVIGMVDDFFERNKLANGFLFDGFPRTVAQATALDKLMIEKSTSLNCLIALKVPEEELVNRLLIRGATSGRSDDVNEQVIRKRLTVYLTETAPVAEYYHLAHKFTEVNGEGTIQEIFSRICQLVNPYF